MHKTGGGANATVGIRGKESLTEPNRAPESVMQVTPVTNESAKAAIFEDLISYLDALLQDDYDCYNRSSFLRLPFDIPYMPVFFFYDVFNLLRSSSFNTCLQH